MKTLLAMIVMVVLAFFFLGYIEVPCSICILSFFVTIHIKRYYYKYQITAEQGDHYSGYNTILNMFLGFLIACYLCRHGSYPVDKSNFYFQHFGDNWYAIENSVFISILVLIAINISQGIHLSQYITNSEADYSRRLYQSQNTEN